MGLRRDAIRQKMHCPHPKVGVPLIPECPSDWLFEAVQPSAIQGNEDRLLTRDGHGAGVRA